jgi:alcohol dehydrogenase (cytochrome c)
MRFRRTAILIVAILAVGVWGWVAWGRLIAVIVPADVEWVVGNTAPSPLQDASLCAYRPPAAPSFQTMPVVVGRMLYLTTATTTAAIDATNCRQIWRYTRRPRTAMGWPNNRGVAVAGGVVYRGTVDGYLMALDAATGALRWERRVADIRRLESLAIAPLVWDSLIFIGPAGSENAIQGWIGAFRVRDGSQAWRFPLVERTTWRVPNGVVTGGGGVWGVLSIDSATGTLYVPTGNPAPDLAGDLREGANLYTNSIVALDAHSGALRWYRQVVSHDTHDRGLTQARVVGNRVITAGKHGIVDALDAATGSVIWETAVVKQFAPTAPPTVTGTYACPGIYGGTLWNGPAVDGNTVYVQSVEFCGKFVRLKRVRYRPGSSYVGGVFDGDIETWGGSVTALDLRTGAIRWQYRDRDPMFGGIVVVDSIVYAGTLRNGVVALGVADGAPRFRLIADRSVGGGLVSYTVDSTRYLAVPNGAASFQFPGAQAGPPTISVFDLSRLRR